MQMSLKSNDCGTFGFITCHDGFNLKIKWTEKIEYAITLCRILSDYFMIVQEFFKSIYSARSTALFLLPSQ